MKTTHISPRPGTRAEILDGEQLQELRVVTTRQVEERVEARLDALVDLLASDRHCAATPMGPALATKTLPSVAQKIELSIVLPCFNEADTIGEAILKIQFALERMGQLGEVLVADLGSFDDSVELAEQLGARVLHVDPEEHDRGLMSSGAGRAILAAARGKVIVLGSKDSTAISPWF